MMELSEKTDEYRQKPGLGNRLKLVTFFKKRTIQTSINLIREKSCNLRREHARWWKMGKCFIVNQTRVACATSVDHESPVTIHHREGTETRGIAQSKTASPAQKMYISKGQRD